MRWSDDLRPRYSVRYERPAERRHATVAARHLLADTLEDAKLEAAILYACIDADDLPPAYRIVKGARRVVYRYPEATHAVCS